MKSSSTDSPSWDGTNTSGFSALPGGWRGHISGDYNEGSNGFWWSASASNYDNGLFSTAWYRILLSGLDNVSRTSYYGMRSGFSVRCVRNFEPNPGCTDPTYLEYNSVANTDDGSCSTAVVNGCTNPAFNEYNPNANADDGSCASLLGCTNSAFVEYNPLAIVDDGSCATLPGCTANDVVSMDGHEYSVVTIGVQCWFKENLRTTQYADGSAIPEVTDGTAWSSTNDGARTAPNDAASNSAYFLGIYGYLYNWHAVNNSAGLCPTGWHVPTDGEWTELTNFLGGSSVAGNKMKSSPSDEPFWNGNNSSGFSALPGGWRDPDYGSFGGEGSYGEYWSASPYGTQSAWKRNLAYGDGVVYRNRSDRRYGFSVRCLRDE
jgi:uncharacterized protein (TIGR02145 family)